MKVVLTGHPFVDVGVAGLCALAGVQSLSALSPQAIRQAIDEAIRTLTSQSAFAKPEKGGAFATGLYSQLFPNSPLPNPSVTLNNKAQRLRERLEEYLQAIFQPDPNSQEGWCFACGEPAYFRVGLDRCPMVGYGEWSNFNPEFKPGATICGFCALAVQFLPFSVMRTRPDGGRLWIFHAYDIPLMVSIAQNYTLQEMNLCIAQNRPLNVYGNWQIQTDEGAIVSLLCELPHAQLKNLINQHVPLSAYFFSNDNRGQYLTRREVPPEVLLFLSALKYHPQSYQQFRQEVLSVPKLGEMVSRAIMNTQPIICLCLDFESDPSRLRGGWRAHKLYAEEVLLMKSTFLRTVEAVGERIATHEDAKKWIQALRSDYTTVSNALLRLVKEGLMTKDEYYLIGKGEVMTTSQYLLGVIFALQNGESLPEDTQAELAGDRHPLIALVEQVGARIVAESERVKRLVQSLRAARNPDMIRRAFLRAVQEGVVRWNEFIQLCPPDDANTHFLARDYLLAYLFDTARNLLPAEDDTTTEEGGSNG